MTEDNQPKNSKFEVGEKRQAPAEVVGEKRQAPVAQGSFAGEANVTVGKDALGGGPKKPCGEKRQILYYYDEDILLL